MARKKVAVDTTRREASEARGYVVVKVGARALVTLDEKHPIWDTGWKHSFGPADAWRGAIVRLRPPSDVDPDHLTRVKALLVEAGVARIKAEVRRGVTLPTEAVEKAKPAVRASARDVVLRLVEESNAVDKDALREIVTRAMDAEGL